MRRLLIEYNLITQIIFSFSPLLYYEFSFINSYYRYLAQIDSSCDAISGERANAQLHFQNDREHILQALNELEQCKHVFWEQTQSLLSHVQTQRQEIESITRVLEERKREKDELAEMLRILPKVD